ncbi:MAG: hypothetical protein WCJ58_01815 [bacterium]
MKTFSFNLIPKKEKAVVVKEEKRDKLSIYSAFLPLLGVIIWLFLTLFNGLIVYRSKNVWTLAVESKKNRLETEFLAVREQHGELVTKTKMLSDIVLKDIKPEILFILTEKIFPVPEPGVRIVGYGRRQDGSFDIYLETPDYQKLGEITRRFSAYHGSTNVSISNASWSPQLVSSTINFNLDVAYIEKNGG